LVKLDQAQHLNSYSLSKISGKVNQQTFFDVLELNTIKLSEKDKG